MTTRVGGIDLLLARFPTLYDDRIPLCSDSELTDLVIATIHRSAEFATLSIEDMAAHYSMGLHERLWAAITVFVPTTKVEAAIELTHKYWQEESDNLDRMDMQYE